MSLLIKISNIFSSILAFAILFLTTNVNSETLNTFRDCDYCPEMVEIEKGSFFMGSDYGRVEEQPIHQVRIKYDFAVGKYEVTRGQYAFFVENSSYPQEIGCETWDLPSFNMNLTKSWVDPDFEQDENHPVVCVNWYDAQAYVDWLTEITGERYRLLSESEWEYVARARSSSMYNFGDNIDSTKANYGDEFRGTTAVGSYAANDFGLHDIHGNASEWVNDCWVDSYEYAPIMGEPVTGESCEKRVFRGGTWNNAAQYLRSAYRYAYLADFKLSGIGFRVGKQL